MQTTLKSIEPIESPLLVSTQEELREAWGKFKHHVSAALKYSCGAFSEDDILLDVVNGRYQMWCGENSIGITQVVQYPNYKALSIIIGAGDVDELREMEQVVTAMAKDEGCEKAVMLTARKGWSRQWSDYKEKSVNLVKDL